MKEKVNNVSKNWFLTFNKPDFKDYELVKVLEDMLDSKILKYAMFLGQNYSGRKFPVELYLVLNYFVNLETLKDRFSADDFEIAEGSLNDYIKYIFRKGRCGRIPYEVGSLKDPTENKFDSKVIKIKGVDYTIEFVDDLQNAYGVTYRDSKKILVTDCDDLFELKKRIVHELLHAYLDECGLINYSSDETLVYWLDYNFFEIYNQVEKILKNKNVEEK